MGFITRIKLDPGHIVYTGHFPGQPVTPGVIQMQIVHELLEMNLRRELKLVSLSQCKFLKILNPVETPKINVSIEFSALGDMLYVKATGIEDADQYFKLNGVYQFSDE